MRRLRQRGLRLPQNGVNAYGFQNFFTEQDRSFGRRLRNAAAAAHARCGHAARTAQHRRPAGRRLHPPRLPRRGGGHDIGEYLRSERKENRLARAFAKTRPRGHRPRAQGSGRQIRGARHRPHRAAARTDGQPHLRRGVRYLRAHDRGGKGSGRHPLRDDG